MLLSNIENIYRGMKIFVKCEDCKINLQNNSPLPESCATNEEQLVLFKSIYISVFSDWASNCWVIASDKRSEKVKD
jgi:hypothetical protein